MTKMPHRSSGSLPFALMVALVVAGVDRGRVWPQGKPAAPVAKDDRALKLLKGMSDSLAQARTLSFRSRSLVPMAGPNGQWLSLITLSRVVMQRPDKLFVEMRG